MEDPTEKLSPTEDRSSALAVASGSALFTAADRMHSAIAVMLKDWGDGDFELPRLAEIHMLELREKYQALGRALRDGLPDGAEVKKARAYQTDETFGYDRWVADEYSCGRGQRDALIVLLPLNIPVTQMHGADGAEPKQKT